MKEHEVFSQPVQEKEPQFSIDYLFYFGSFNPPTYGHYWAMSESLSQVKPKNGLVILPGSTSHWKNNLVSYEHRRNMLFLGLQEFPELERAVRLSHIERDLQLSGFTVETLQKYHAAVGEDKQLGFVVGADIIQSFDQWRCWQEIINTNHLFVLPRGELSTAEAIQKSIPAAVKEYAGDKIHPLMVAADSPYLNASTTDVRDSLETGEESAFIPAAILGYIREHQLYK
jgi:nicotinate-nucleotide adenylyltransferase